MDLAPSVDRRTWRHRCEPRTGEDAGAWGRAAVPLKGIRTDRDFNYDFAKREICAIPLAVAGSSPAVGGSNEERTNVAKIDFKSSRTTGNGREEFFYSKRP